MIEILVHAEDCLPSNNRSMKGQLENRRQQRLEEVGFKFDESEAEFQVR